MSALLAICIANIICYSVACFDEKFLILSDSK